MAALRSNLNRYHSYSSNSSAAETRDSSSSSPEREQPQGMMAHTVNGDHDSRSNTGVRLEHIINSMAYIRGELDGLKESDRVLLDIFKQLENNVSELTDSLSALRVAGNNPSPGRPISFTDLDFGTPRSPYCQSSTQFGFNGLETILDSSKEDISYKTSTESDSLYLAEQESSSTSCSPILRPLQSHASVPSINSSGSNGALKRPSNPSPPLIKPSASFNSRLASSPSIARLQDETSSNISRNSSIDSGIQFASEVESGSANGVEAIMQPLTTPLTTPAAPEESEDVRKSVGFADDIFAALGLK